MSGGREKCSSFLFLMFLSFVFLGLTPAQSFKEAVLKLLHQSFTQAKYRTQSVMYVSLDQRINLLPYIII